MAISGVRFLPEGELRLSLVRAISRAKVWRDYGEKKSPPHFGVGGLLKVSITAWLIRPSRIEEDVGVAVVYLQRVLLKPLHMPIPESYVRAVIVNGTNEVRVWSLEKGM